MPKAEYLQTHILRTKIPKNIYKIKNILKNNGQLLQHLEKHVTTSVIKCKDHGSWTHFPVFTRMWFTTRSEKTEVQFLYSLGSGCSLSRSVLAGGRRPLLLPDHWYRRCPTGLLHHGHCDLPLPWQGEVHSYGIRLHSVLNHRWVTGHWSSICGKGCTIFKFSEL